MPLLLSRRATGVLSIELRFKAERNFERTGKFFGVVASMIAHAIKVQKLLEADRERLVQENVRLQGELRERYDFSHLLGTSRAMHEVCEQVTQVARTNTTVLIRGESGHRQGADRPGDPLQLAALGQAVRQGELRGAARHADRVGAVRLRERRVHRRDGAQGRAVRARRRRLAVPRRDRRCQPRRPGEAAARAAGA